jgi:hypothetical protein
MRTLPRDSLGYPIPTIVLVDKSRKPQFTINDLRKVGSCLRKRLCAICGKRLDDGYWFVGGSRCFMHENGAFVNPPLHRDCGQYALQVCPFLAAPSYSKRIDGKKMRAKDRPDHMAIIEIAHMPPAQPTTFGFGQTREFRIVQSQMGQSDHVLVVESWDYVEWWKNGELVNAPDSVASETSPSV